MIHADGFTRFNGLFGVDRASEQACMVHVRRQFIDVYESEGSAIAEETIKRIAALYAVKKEARYKSPDERVALRQTKAKPVFDDLGAWLALQLPKISGKSTLASAPIMLGEYHATFLAAEILASSIHRNILRPMGRECWNCNLSLSSVDPEAWLRWVLVRAADRKMPHIHELMPWDRTAE